MILQKISKVRTLFPSFPSFSPNFFSFVMHEHEGSRQNHKFTTCVHDFTACLGQNRSRDHGEHEFTTQMERSIIPPVAASFVHSTTSLQISPSAHKLTDAMPIVDRCKQ